MSTEFTCYTFNLLASPPIAAIALILETNLFARVCTYNMSVKITAEITRMDDIWNSLSNILHLQNERYTIIIFQCIFNLFYPTPISGGLA